MRGKNIPVSPPRWRWSQVKDEVTFWCGPAALVISIVALVVAAR